MVVLGHKDSHFPLGKATEQLQSKIYRKHWRLSAEAVGLCVKGCYKVSQQGTNISSKHLVHCKPIMTIPQKAKDLERLLQGPQQEDNISGIEAQSFCILMLLQIPAGSNITSIVLCFCVSYEVS